MFDLEDDLLLLAFDEFDLLDWYFFLPPLIAIPHNSILHLYSLDNLVLEKENSFI